MATTVSPERVAAPPGPSRRRISLAPYLFILPHALLFAVFLGYPFLNGLYISFLQYDFLRPLDTKFVGLANYTRLFSSDNASFQPFWNSLTNTLKFVVYSVPLLVVIPLLLAVLLNTKIRGRNFFRAIYFAPWALSVAVVSLLWWWIFQSQGGLITYYMTSFGIKAPRWLSTLPWAWVTIVTATVWWTIGFNMIILLAALQNIPGYLYEAAGIDGANTLQQFTKITVPMLRPVLTFIVTTSIIASFNLFGQPFFMTGGGPAKPGGGGGTEPIMLQIYRAGFERNTLGAAAAMSFLVAALMIAISYANFKLFQQRD